MRFVLAIASLILAAVLIVLGIAQRTIFLGPATFKLDAAVSSTQPYTVVPGSVLTSQPGTQSLTVSSGNDSDVFVGYGATSDVDAWIGNREYNAVALSEDGSELVSKEATMTLDPSVVIPPAPEGVDPATWANPRGSDLWLEESSEKGTVITSMNVPDDMSLIIATNGTDPAPQNITITWPVDNSTPWAGPLIALGLLLLLLGIVLYLLGIRHMRRARGPRRKGNAPLPEEGSTVKLPRARKYRPGGGALGEGSRGRRSLIAVPVILVGALSLGGCSAAYWPQLPTDAAPSATESAATEAAPEDGVSEGAGPVVTEPQAERIITRIAAVATAADSSLDVNALKTRFAGPALAEREANYKIRKTATEVAPIDTINGSPVKLTLPQTTDSWPRTVISVVQDPEDATLPTSLLVMTQDSPRANYAVHYSVRLEPKVTFPQVAPVKTGAALVPDDSGFLVMAPNQIAGAYGDLIAKGGESEYAALFDTEDDTLLTKIAEFRKSVTDSMKDKAAKAEFGAAAGPGAPVALATNDSGAIVAVNMRDTVKISPTDQGAKIKTDGDSVAALLGATETTKPLLTTYEDQLLFYVPPVGSTEKITLLGFSQGLIGAEAVE